MSEDNQCPQCGGPIEECTDPANEFRWVGTGPVPCHRARATSVRQSQYFKQFNEANQAAGGPPVNHDALLWGVKERN